MQPFAAARILDLTRGVTGPYATRLLAGLGAAVIKVEPPRGGDPSRAMGPFPGDTPHGERSALFHYLNPGKHSVTADIESATGCFLIAALARWAHVVVEDFPPGFLAARGLGFERLAAINPSLIALSVTPFGQTGPYSSYTATEGVLEAMGGPMLGNGTSDREPYKYPGHVMEFYAGSAAAVAIAAPLYGRLFTSERQPVHLDLSVMEMHLASADRRAAALLAYQYTGELMMKRRRVGELRVGHGIRRCKDGYISIHAGGPRLPRLLAMLAEGSSARVPSVADARTSEGRSRIEELLWQWLSERTREDVWEAALRHKVPLAPVRTPKDIAATRVSSGSPMALRAFPFEAPSGFWSQQRTPLLGEHNAAVYSGLLGIAPAELRHLRQAGVI
jgi:crotonobetainyl-CoA:carnitine CoA-transferase CaiB-like acyl-CoA transferase